MSDNLRRSRAIRHALAQCYPIAPPRELRSPSQPPGCAYQRHRGQQEYSTAPSRHEGPRWHQAREPRQTLCEVVRQRPHPGGVYFLPYADVLLRHLALQTVVLVMDGSGVGRGCTALMLHVVYKGRALPPAWRVRQAPKGHVPADLHIAVVELLREVIPEGVPVVFLGDGECDGTALQATLHEAGWSYAAARP